MGQFHIPVSYTHLLQHIAGRYRHFTEAHGIFLQLYIAQVEAFIQFQQYAVSYTHLDVYKRQSLLRAVGDSVTPLWFLAVSVVLNIALDLFFILQLDWGRCV